MNIRDNRRKKDIEIIQNAFKKCHFQIIENPEQLFWVTIRTNYPAAYSEFKQTGNFPDIRKLYDHFDDLKIHVCPEYCGQFWRVWVSELTWVNVTGKTRSDVELKGFEEAFKLRELQIKGY